MCYIRKKLFVSVIFNLTRVIFWLNTLTLLRVGSCSFSSIADYSSYDHFHITAHLSISCIKC